MALRNLIAIFLSSLICCSALVNCLSTSDLFLSGQTSGDELDQFVTNGAPVVVTLSLPIVLYGQKYNTAYVSSKGIVAFKDIGSSFQSTPFPLSYAAIAPYYADIDTEESGLISARETRKQELLDKANAYIHQYFPEQQSFQAQTLLIATWSEVVGKGQPSSWLNSFQLVVANNGEDSFGLFLYPEQSLAWSKTAAAVEGAPEVFAQGGIISHDGKFQLLEGSGTDYMRGLAGIGRPEGAAPGIHAFRLGVVAEKALEDEQTNQWEQQSGGYTREPIDTRHPLDPAVLGELGSEENRDNERGREEDEHREQATPPPPAGPNLGQLGNPVCTEETAAECHSSATCNALSGGSCCQCGADTMGNGKICLDKVKPIQMNGAISGNLNGVELPSSLMHNYVITEEGRAYVAYSPVPVEIGQSLQTVIPVATIIGWMFATTEDGLSNGFVQTGGVANYTAVVRFTESGNSVHISQTFSGLDEHKFLYSTMYVSGNTPTVHPDQSFTFPDHHIDYRRSIPGLVQSFSRGTFQVDEVSHPYTVEESITFQECPFVTENSAAPKTTRLHISAIVSLYQAKEKASRYSVIAKLTLPGAGVSDNCALVDCGQSASCVPGDGEETQCICRAGYQVRAGSDAKAKPLDCEDINECAVRNECNQNAECINTQGSFTCRCLSGYTGDGRVCRTAEELSLGDCVAQPEICGANAQCQSGGHGRGECVCFPGYVGDGRSCQLEGAQVVTAPIVPPDSCYHNPAQCDRHAACIPDQRSRGQFACQCLQGYEGDGLKCRAKLVSRGGFLAFNQGMSVVQLPLDANAQDRGGQLAIVPGQTAVGIAVDCSNALLYWSDIAGNTINRARYDGSEVEVVVRDIVKSVEGLAIDHVSGNIFWTDSDFDHIAVAKLSDLKPGADKVPMKVVISKNLNNPRSIAVHPARGSIYWTDWNRLEPKIETSNSDGSERQALINRDLQLPNALTIDFQTDDLCWADAGSQKIECASLNGHNRRLIFVGNTYPFGITLHSNTIFWTDWTSNTVMSVSKHGGVSRSYELPIGSSGKVYGIVAVPEQCPRLHNACASGNGGCDRNSICLPLPGGRNSCVCPDNLDAGQCTNQNRV